MNAGHGIALMLFIVISFAIAKNWKKVLLFGCTVLMTAVLFGVYSVVVFLQSDCDPAQLRTPGNEIAAARSS
jgi:hypothetical protein